MKITGIVLGIMSILGLLLGSEILVNTSSGSDTTVLYDTVGESLFFISFIVITFLMVKKGFSKGSKYSIFR